LGLCKPIHELYGALDRRYTNGDPTVLIVSIIELVFMGPACLYVARLTILNQGLKREIWSIIVSVAQVTGCLVFTG